MIILRFINAKDYTAQKSITITSKYVIKPDGCIIAIALILALSSTKN